MVLNNENALLPNLHFAEVLGTQTISVFIYDEKVFPEGLSVRKIHPFLPSPYPKKRSFPVHILRKVGLILPGDERRRAVAMRYVTCFHVKRGHRTGFCSFQF